MRYGEGRPLWQMSIAHQTIGGPLQVLRWSPTKWHKAEAVRDRIMRGAGTDEPWFRDEEEAQSAVRTAQWRKPLRIDEVNQLAQTAQVRAREGRP
jgi:hypothetical protein